MAEFEFSQQDINDLADKVSNLVEDLQPQERRLLIAIFAAAANRADFISGQAAKLPVPAVRADNPQAAASADLTAEQLKQQLLNAYIPGNDFDLITDNEDLPTEISQGRIRPGEIGP